jgi:cytochrome c-type biogenesis protein CcmH/NrfG
LTPDSGELQVSLGDAYLNLGQEDKALAAFDHAVELNPHSDWSGTTSPTSSH